MFSISDILQVREIDGHISLFYNLFTTIFTQFQPLQESKWDSDLVASHSVRLYPLLRNLYVYAKVVSHRFLMLF